MTSTLGSTTLRVPQGSVLGPFFIFIMFLYINDISTNEVNNVRLFADDTSLYVIVDKDRIGAANSLTSDLDQLDQWSKQ